VFLTTYRSFIDNQAFNITTILADRSFIYLTTPIKPPVSILIKPAIDITNRKQDLFAYITTKCYNSKQFYSIIIDIGVFKIFTIGYRQYLAYRNTITNNTDIDTSRIRAINI
jgi:hypothetical protein